VPRDLLLIPGLLCDRRLWSGQTDALAGRASCHIADLTTGESVTAMADAVLERAPASFALAGFSLGGCVALEIVARTPRRVSQLALLSTREAGLLPAVREHYEASIAAIEAGGLERYLADAFPRYVAPGRAHEATLWSAFVAMGRSLGAAVAVRQMRALLDYPGFGGDLRDIDCPTALICGSEDARTPVAVHREMARQIPGAQLAIIEGSGHFTPLEEPVALARVLLAWLARRD
jgi:pimeloyl-ACP methyl ester carboxylesterase